MCSEHPTAIDHTPATSWPLRAAHWASAWVGIVGGPYREVYTEKQRSTLERAFAREISPRGYRFQ